LYEIIFGDSSALECLLDNHHLYLLVMFNFDFFFFLLLNFNDFVFEVVLAEQFREDLCSLIDIVLRWENISEEIEFVFRFDFEVSKTFLVHKRIKIIAVWTRIHSEEIAVLRRREFVVFFVVIVDLEGIFRFICDAEFALDF